MKWKRTSKFVKAKQCKPEANILLDIPENAKPLLIFEGTSNLNELVKHICDQRNLYAIQNGKELPTNPKQISPVLRINCIILISKLPNVNCYWSVDSYLSSDCVRNATTRSRFMNIHQNLHFTDFGSISNCFRISGIKFFMISKIVTV